MRQPHQLNANRRHVHLIEIKYCEDTRPGQQLGAAQRQHANLGNLINAKTPLSTPYFWVLVGPALESTTSTSLRN
eukprot:1155900-Pelagomonas_calceolata.AAC.3